MQSRAWRHFCAVEKWSRQRGGGGGQNPRFGLSKGPSRRATNEWAGPQTKGRAEVNTRTGLPVMLSPSPPAISTFSATAAATAANNKHAPELANYTPSRPGRQSNIVSAELGALSGASVSLPPLASQSTSRARLFAGAGGGRPRARQPNKPILKRLIV